VKQNTPVAPKGGAAPNWNAKISTISVANVGADLLSLEILDKPSFTTAKRMGTATVAIKTLSEARGDVGGVVDMWYAVAPQGEIRIRSKVTILSNASIPLAVAPMAQPMVPPQQTMQKAPQQMMALPLQPMQQHQQQQNFQVTIPAGVGAGQQMQVSVPQGYPSTGQLVTFAVPQGVQPGQAVNIPLPAAAPIAQPMAPPQQTMQQAPQQVMAPPQQVMYQAPQQVVMAPPPVVVVGGGCNRYGGGYGGYGRRGYRHGYRRRRGVGVGAVGGAIVGGAILGAVLF